MLSACNRFAKIGTLGCAIAVFIGALLCSIPALEASPQVAHVKLVLTWWMAGGLVIFPLVAAVLWLGCAYALLLGKAWRALRARGC